MTWLSIIIAGILTYFTRMTMIASGLSSLLFFDAPFKSYIIISPLIHLIVAALLLSIKK